MSESRISIMPRVSANIIPLGLLHVSGGGSRADLFLEITMDERTFEKAKANKNWVAENDRLFWKRFQVSRLNDPEAERLHLAYQLSLSDKAAYKPHIEQMLKAATQA